MRCSHLPSSQSACVLSGVLIGSESSNSCPVTTKKAPRCLSLITWTVFLLLFCWSALVLLSIEWGRFSVSLVADPQQVVRPLPLCQLLNVHCKNSQEPKEHLQMFSKSSETIIWLRNYSTLTQWQCVCVKRIICFVRNVFFSTLVVSVYQKVWKNHREERLF